MPASNRRSLLRSSALAGAGQQTMSFSFSHAQSRRRFLAGPGSAVVCFPLVSRASHAASVSGRLRHASFGVSGAARADLNAPASHLAVEVVAGCDVDERGTVRFREEFPKTAFTEGNNVAVTLYDVIFLSPEGLAHAQTSAGADGMPGVVPMEGSADVLKSGALTHSLLLARPNQPATDQGRRLRRPA